MLIVTDLDSINAAYEAATPRPIREVILDVYPDATEDRNGRFHAPYDGYICPITDREFRGGEYLPTEELEDPFEAAMRSPARNYPQATDLDGNVHRWEGTRAQCRAVWPLLIAQTRAYEASVSEHVGTVGRRIDLHDLTLQFIRGFDTYYGMKWVHVMKDDDGNVVVYKGSKRLRSGPNPYLDRDLKPGDKVSLRATVKQHGEREGVKQTIINRPAAI